MRKMPLQKRKLWFIFCRGIGTRDSYRATLCQQLLPQRSKSARPRYTKEQKGREEPWPISLMAPRATRRMSKGGKRNWFHTRRNGEKKKVTRKLNLRSVVKIHDFNLFVIISSFPYPRSHSNILGCLRPSYISPSFCPGVNTSGGQAQSPCSRRLPM